MVKDEKSYDLIIMGAGPAGYTASIYASRYKVKNMIIGKLPGGLITEAHIVTNYPGFIEIHGIELGMKMKEHAKSLGADELQDEILEVKKNKKGFKIITRDNGEFEVKSILIATGTDRRRLGLDNEEEFYGKGVTYCATCDGPFYKDKVVAVIGGSDSANTASLILKDIAKKVYQIYRKDKLRGDQLWIDQILASENVEVIYNTNVVEMSGKDKLEKVKLDKKYDGREYLEVDGLFIEIGAIPASALVADLGVDIEDGGYIKVNPDQSTNIKGLYAAGDITNASNYFRQAVCACSEGAIAAESIHKYLGQLK